MSMHDPCCSLPCHLTRHRVSRRRVLAHLTGLVVGGVSALTWLEGCESRTSSTPPPATPTSTLYPNLAGQFGSVLSVGKTAEFPAALPSKCKLNQAGVFYHQLARTYIVHLDKATAFLLTGKVLQDRLAAETILRDADGSYWMALYQKCVHLGCMVQFRDDCVSFKCPCHGSHYHVDGEYLDGEAPRSMDRFPLAFQGDEVVVDTGRVNNRVPRPESATRLIAVPGRACGL